MSIGPGQVKTGMAVVGSDRVTVGKVADARADDFLILRPFEPPITLPYTAVRDVANQVVTVMGPAKEIANSSPPTTDLRAPFARTAVHVGMGVLATDGVSLGTVRAIRGSSFLVDRPVRRDVYIPFDLIRAVVDDQVVIDLPAGQVDQMDWPVG